MNLESLSGHTLVAWTTGLSRRQSTNGGHPRTVLFIVTMLVLEFESRRGEILNLFAETKQFRAPTRSVSRQNSTRVDEDRNTWNIIAIPMQFTNRSGQGVDALWPRIWVKTRRNGRAKIIHGMQNEIKNPIARSWSWVSLVFGYPLLELILVRVPSARSQYLVPLAPINNIHGINMHFFCINYIRGMTNVPPGAILLTPPPEVHEARHHERWRRT